MQLFLFCFWLLLIESDNLHLTHIINTVNYIQVPIYENERPASRVLAQIISARMAIELSGYQSV